MDNRIFLYLGVVKIFVSFIFFEYLGCVGFRLEFGFLNGCFMFSEKGFIKWVIIDVEKNEYEKDFLRLIKINLILYYMF